MLIFLLLSRILICFSVKQKRKRKMKVLLSLPLVLCLLNLQASLSQENYANYSCEVYGECMVEDNDGEVLRVPAQKAASPPGVHAPSGHHHDDHDDHHHHHPAMHQMEHRATEKVSVGVAQHLTEQAAKQGEKLLARKVAQRTAEKSAARVVSRVGESVESGLFRFYYRMGETMIERPLSTAGRIGEKVLEHTAGRAFVKQGERFSIKKVLQGVRGGVTAVRRRATPGFVRGNGSLKKRMNGAPMPSSVASSMQHGHVVSRQVNAHLERKATGSMLWASLSKKLVVAVPLVGGFFTLALFLSDWERLKEEWAERRKGSTLLFVGAALSDLVDAVSHFWISFALHKHISHGVIAAVEELSTGCAILSTVCAITGEMISHHLRHR